MSNFDYECWWSLHLRVAKGESGLTRKHQNIGWVWTNWKACRSTPVTTDSRTCGRCELLSIGRQHFMLI